MHLTHISADHFKNLHEISIDPAPGYNIIFGENGAGKTNLLEAIWSLTGCKSFRGSNWRDFPDFSKKNVLLDVSADLVDIRRTQNLHLRMFGEKRRFWQNDVPATGASIFHTLQCVAFVPGDIDLVNGPPGFRRNYIDISASQIYSAMFSRVVRYNSLLQQRNATLRNVMSHQMSSDECTRILDALDPLLAESGAAISNFRAKYVAEISPICADVYAKISGGREVLALRYLSDIFGEKIPPAAGAESKYRKRLDAERTRDMRTFRTNFGAHHDDIILSLNGHRARDFASQGQRKSIAITLRIACAYHLAKLLRDPPVLLLDDVMGELDPHRQDVIFDLADGMQIFMTTCHPEVISRGSASKLFEIRDGKIV